MLAINFPHSAAWNDAIRPAIDKAGASDEWAAALDSVTFQLAAGVGPEDVMFRGAGSKSGDAEKEKLVAVGAKFVIEAVLQAAPPGVAEDDVRDALMAGSAASATAGATAGLALEAATAAARAFVSSAKRIATAQRARAIEDICHRRKQSEDAAGGEGDDDEDGNVLRYLSAEVRICRRQEGGAVREEGVMASDSLFEPVANFAIAPESIDVASGGRSGNGGSAQRQFGINLALSPAQTYELLCEVDAIQKKLDALRG